MGRFFNTMVMNLRRFPVGRDMEKMRRKYNERVKEETVVPILSPEEIIRIKRVANMAKAREVRAKKREEKHV